MKHESDIKWVKSNDKWLGFINDTQRFSIDIDVYNGHAPLYYTWNNYNSGLSFINQYNSLENAMNGIIDYYLSGQYEIDITAHEMGF